MKLKDLVFWLHAQSLELGTIPAFDGVTLHQALLFFDGLRGTVEAFDAAGLTEEAVKDLTDASTAGIEIYEERPRSQLAKAIARRAYTALENLDAVLFLMEDTDGAYTPLVVRALLTHHFWDLKTAALGSDENCVYIDLVAAINAATAQTRTVCWMLVGGVGTQDIGTFFGTNGSRVVRRAALELAQRMEGTYVEQTKRKRRKHSHHRQQRPDDSAGRQS